MRMSLSIFCLVTDRSSSSTSSRGCLGRKSFKKLSARCAEFGDKHPEIEKKETLTVEMRTTPKKIKTLFKTGRCTDKIRDIWLPILTDWTQPASNWASQLF